MIMKNPFGLRIYQPKSRAPMTVTGFTKSDYVNPRNAAHSEDLFPLTHDYKKHMKSREVLEQYRG